LFRSKFTVPVLASILILAGFGLPDAFAPGHPFPPRIICPLDITLNTGEDTSPANTGAATATDDNPTDPILTFSDDVSQAFDGTTTIVRTWTATDVDGNTDSCSQIITILPPAVCGDGIVTAPETCDDGDDNGTPGLCSITCNGIEPGALSVTKTATPQDINLFGLGGVETTTVEIGIEGFGEDSMVDVMFLMDASGSVGPTDFLIEKAFVRDIINTVFPDPEDRVSIVRFSTTIDTIHQFTDTQTRNNLESIVNNITYPGGWTDTLGALNRAISEFDTLSSPEKDKLIIIITDGNPIVPNGAQDVCPLDSDLDNRGIKVVFVTVGSSVDTSKIDCLVDDIATDIISVTDFNNLDGLVAQFGLDNAPSNVDLVETTQSYIINEGSFSIPPDTIVTLPGGQTQLTWLNLGQLEAPVVLT